MRFPIRFWTALGGLLSTGVALLALLGPWDLSAEQQAAIIAFGNAAILTLSVVFSEQQTTPLADPRLEAGTSFKVTDAAGVPLAVQTAKDPYK